MRLEMVTPHSFIQLFSGQGFERVFKDSIKLAAAKIVIFTT